jgi:hypothetical protein
MFNCELRELVWINSAVSAHFGHVAFASSTERAARIPAFRFVLLGDERHCSKKRRAA